MCNFMAIYFVCIYKVVIFAIEKGLKIIWKIPKRKFF